MATVVCKFDEKLKQQRHASVMVCIEIDSFECGFKVWMTFLFVWHLNYVHNTGTNVQLNFIDAAKSLSYYVPLFALYLSRSSMLFPDTVIMYLCLPVPIYRFSMLFPDTLSPFLHFPAATVFCLGWQSLQSFLSTHHSCLVWFSQYFELLMH